MDCCILKINIKAYLYNKDNHKLGDYIFMKKWNKIVITVILIFLAIYVGRFH